MQYQTQYQTQYAWITRLISLLVFTGLLAHSLAGIRPIRAQGVADLAAPPVLTFTAPEDMSDAVGIASAGLPSPVFDMNQVAWMSIRGLTSAEHQQFFDDTDKAAYLAIDVEAYPLKGEDRYGSVWQENPDGRGWLLRRNLTFDEFDKLNKEQYLAGYRLIDQNIYFQDGAVLYSAIWIENVEGLNWVNFVNLTEADHIVMSNRMVETGMIPIDIEVYTGGPNPRYSTVWVENVENLDFLLLVDMSEDFFVAKWEEVKATLRVVDLESYMLNGKQYYAAIWYQNTNGRGWASLANLTGQGFSNAWHEWRDAGYRLIDFEAYPTANGLRYAGVWRQNGERISWRLKNQVTDLAQAYFDNNPVAGMSVAIAVDGPVPLSQGIWFCRRRGRQDSPLADGLSPGFGE